MISEENPIMLKSHLDSPTRQGHTSLSLAAIVGTIQSELAAWQTSANKLSHFSTCGPNGPQGTTNTLCCGYEVRTRDKTNDFGVTKTKRFAKTQHVHCRIYHGIETRIGAIPKPLDAGRQHRLSRPTPQPLGQSVSGRPHSHVQLCS